MIRLRCQPSVGLCDKSQSQFHDCSIEQADRSLWSTKYKKKKKKGKKKERNKKETRKKQERKGKKESVRDGRGVGREAVVAVDGQGQEQGHVDEGVVRGGE
jgi:hypothetical protein